MSKVLFFLFITLTLSGCKIGVQPLPLNKETNLFPASEGKIKPEEVVIYKGMTNKSKVEFVLLNEFFPSYWNEKVAISYNNLHKASLSDAGFKVYEPRELKDFIIEKGWDTSGTQLTANDLNLLREKVGNYLVLNIIFKAENSEWNRYSINAFEHETETPIFRVSHVPLVWTSAEKEMIYPAINEFLKWYREQKPRANN